MKIFILTGPTASGKSNLAINLAKQTNSEIINIDSMQIYSEIPIISAIPIIKDNILHHLYGFVNANEKYSNIKLIEKILEKIEELREKSKNAILIGGSCFYVNTLINGISEIPTVKDEILENTKELINKNLDEIYQKVILDNNLNINKNDKQRIMRAASVFYQTGKCISYFFKKKRTFLNKNDKIIKLILLPNREIINENIKIRIDEMIQNNLFEEVKNFLEKYKNQEYKAFQAYKAIGIRTTESFIKNEINLIEFKEKFQIETRQYVKKQMTWFRKFNNFIQINENTIELFTK